KSFLEALHIYPVGATVLLSDNTTAIVEETQHFSTLPSLKRLYQGNQVLSLPIDHGLTVTKLIKVHSIPFQTGFRKFILFMKKGNKASVLNKFDKLIDGLRLEDIYTNVLLPAYWELHNLVSEQIITQEEYRAALHIVTDIVKNLRNDMLRANK